MTCTTQNLRVPGQVRAPLELTANVATPFPGMVTLLKQTNRQTKNYNGEQS